MKTEGDNFCVFKNATGKEKNSKQCLHRTIVDNAVKIDRSTKTDEQIYVSKMTNILRD